MSKRQEMQRLQLQKQYAIHLGYERLPFASPGKCCAAKPLPELKESCSKPCASGHEGNCVSEVEISLSPLPHVLMWKAEFSNFLFLFAAIERAKLDVDAQQLEVMWLMMLQLDKGGNGKNPADFSECWIKHFLNYLNSSKISLSPFFLLIIGIVSSMFSQRGNHYFLFHPFILQTTGRIIYFGTRSYMASFSWKAFYIHLSYVPLLIKQMSPMLMVQTVLFSMHN